MKSLFEETVFQEILGRLDKLRVENQRQWGSMDIGKMLKHLSITYNMALGKINVEPDRLQIIASTGFGKWLLLEKLKWPKNMITAKELKVHEIIDFDAAKDDLTEHIKELYAKEAEFHFGSHPIFGKLTKNEWGILQYKHTDHHLRQFGE